MYPISGSPEELAQFDQLQNKLPELFKMVSQDNRMRHTIVVVPSLSMDPRELQKISGVHHYEERMLYMLMLLKEAQTRVILVTSQALSPTVIDYYLHLLKGVPPYHARRRLELFDCADASAMPLSLKIPRRPRLLERIKDAIGDRNRAHLVCFNSTAFERTLAVRLGIPLYANDPSINHLGTKSGCREVFRAAGVLFPDGFENLQDENDIAESLNALYMKNPKIKRAVVKLNHGFSGEGNALFTTTASTPATASREQSKSEPSSPNCALKRPWKTGILFTPSFKT